MSSVIVFGPTGGVASVAARAAQENGAKVFLAMRDTQKAIPGLSAEAEQEGGYQRVQADLTQPDLVAAAVQASGATRAFIYLVHGTPDHMRATLAALKSAGITFVVFLSSCAIMGEPKDVVPSEIIPFVHAQVEISLDEIFGLNYVALRPGSFATNLLWFKKGIEIGEVKIYAPKFRFDYITPEDIGRIGGTILVQGPRNNQQKIYLYGPKIIAQEDGISVVAKSINKDVKITTITEQEALDQYIQAGIPKAVAEYILRKSGSTSNELTDRPCYEIGVENVQLYTGKPPTGLEDWVKANKGLFSG
ncbi:hypothetical protein FE257_008394 [Aspergillus nanangensis]|uniref:NmrA-like domain-containing protein n=1 Tax=Aspergillus nanangensis TaxID=2582783 RepID=A0AAD4CLF0_ASPNN|nr:hypothetical protein FE257_008394 [Aspergillus nanangensis]